MESEGDKNEAITSFCSKGGSLTCFTSFSHARHDKIIMEEIKYLIVFAILRKL